MDVDDDARTIGQRLRQIRKARGKSLEVIAGLAGISRSNLSRIERGERALDSRSETVALANALQIAPRDLTRLPVPAPGNGDTDTAIDAVRQALMAVSRNLPGGQVLPVDVLRIRVCGTARAAVSADWPRSAAALPALIRDLHTTMAAGRDVAELLDLAVLLHTQGSVSWLRVAGASVDLRRRRLAGSRAGRAARRADHDGPRGVW